MKANTKKYLSKLGGQAVDSGALKWVILAVVFIFFAKAAGKLLKGFVVQMKSLFGLLPTEEDLQAQAAEQTAMIQDQMEQIIQNTWNGQQPPEDVDHYEMLADRQEQLMKASSLNFNALINDLKDLNSVELCAVNAAFGGRVDRQYLDEPMTLFDWYGDKLSHYGGGFFGPTQTTIMRELWRKSHIPITF